MSTQNRYENYLRAILPAFSPYDFKDKEVNVSNNIRYMLARTVRMFRWDGLPESIPARALETYLQTNGNACFAKVNDDVYVFIGGLGGEPNAYYMPTIYTVANPYLRYSANLEIGKNCVVMPNDSSYIGLLPLMSYYCTAMVENRITMNLFDIFSRVMALITTPDDRTYDSAKAFIDDIVRGEYSAMSENQFLDGIKSLPFGQRDGGRLTDLIEYEQYLKAGMYNELGLNANYNMKRESLTSSETEMDNTSMLPLIDDMLMCRKEFAEKVNEMFELSISVELDSSWKLFHDEVVQNVYNSTDSDTSVISDTDVTSENSDSPEDEVEESEDDRKEETE